MHQSVAVLLLGIVAAANATFYGGHMKGFRQYGGYSKGFGHGGLVDPHFGQGGILGGSGSYGSYGGHGLIGGGHGYGAYSGVGSVGVLGGGFGSYGRKGYRSSYSKGISRGYGGGSFAQGGIGGSIGGAIGGGAIVGVGEDDDEYMRLIGGVGGHVGGIQQSSIGLYGGYGRPHMGGYRQQYGRHGGVRIGSFKYSGGKPFPGGYY